MSGYNEEHMSHFTMQKSYLFRTRYRRKTTEYPSQRDIIAHSMHEAMALLYREFPGAEVISIERTGTVWL